MKKIKDLFMVRILHFLDRGDYTQTAQLIEMYEKLMRTK